MAWVYTTYWPISSYGTQEDDEAFFADVETQSERGLKFLYLMFLGYTRIKFFLLS
jgi:hypothetical protein